MRTIARTSSLICMACLMALAFPVARVNAAAAPALQWQRTFGGEQHDAFESVQETSDGGYIMAGLTNYQDFKHTTEAYLVKTTADGTLIWEKKFGGSSDVLAYCVQETTEGEYILAGELRLSDGTTDAFLLKTTSGGALTWKKTFGGSGDDKGYCVQETTDGGYILAGEKTDDVSGTTGAYLVKTDESGNPRWQKTYGGEGSEWAASVHQTADGGYVLAGYTNSDPSMDNDMYLAKTDQNGTLSWEKSFGTAGSDWLESVQQTNDGGYIIAGGSQNTAYLAKTNSKGDIGWVKNFSGTNGGWSFSARQTRGGNYILSGYFQNSTGRNQAFLLKTDPSGVLLWQNTFGGDSFAGGNAVRQTRDAGYIVAGYTSSFGAGKNDAYLVKCAADGETPLPIITSIQPDSGPVGSEVVIFGSSFGANRGSSFVKFNTSKAAAEDYLYWSNSSIKVRVPAGATTGPVIVEASIGTSNYFTFAVTPQQPPSGETNPTWYLAEGSSAWGFDTYVTIMNPNPSAVTARVTYMTGRGMETRPDIRLPAESQTVINPRNDLGPTDFSTRVDCVEGKAIAADRRMIWTGRGAPSQEGHASLGVSTPAKTWYLAEGSSAWGFETWLLVQNPNRSDADCTVTYMIEGEQARTFRKKIKANTRATFNIADDIGAKDTSIKVDSNIPVIAERSMYRDIRRGGHNSIGTVTPSLDYYLAEGTTAWGFTSYVLVQNPNAEAADIKLTYMTPSGAQPQPTLRMPAMSRKTIKVNNFLKEKDFSTHVQASIPIIAERAMYWNNGTGEACHDCIGMDSPHRAFYFPDGETTNGHETWTLVQNPNDAEVEVKISYLTPTGRGNKTLVDRVPGNSRKSYSMADVFPSGRAAIIVASRTSGKKILVERSMYWNSRGAGTDTIGGWAD